MFIFHNKVCTIFQWNWMKKTQSVTWKIFSLHGFSKTTFSWKIHFITLTCSWMISFGWKQIFLCWSLLECLSQKWSLKKEVQQSYTKKSVLFHIRKWVLQLLHPPFHCIFRFAHAHNMRRRRRYNSIVVFLFKDFLSLA